MQAKPKQEATRRIAMKRPQVQKRQGPSPLDAVLQSAEGARKTPNKQVKIPAWEKERLNGAKLYRLTAYTTRDKIIKKFKAEARQSLLQKTVSTLLILLFILLILGRLIPMQDRSELDRINGENSILDQLGAVETTIP